MARSPVSAIVPGRLLELHGNMPPREMIIHGEAVCEDTLPPDRTRLTGRPGTKKPPERAVLVCIHLLYFFDFPLTLIPARSQAAFMKA